MRSKYEWSIGTKRFYTDFMFAPMLNGEMPAELLARIAEVPNESEQTKLRAVTAFKNTLRGLVDQWIDSGRCDGVEDAWKRDVKWGTGKQRPLIEILSDYRRRNPPQAEPGEDGRFDIWMLPARLGSKEPVLRARDMAIYCFIFLLDSPTRERFSRCDACSTYFVRARVPRKDMPVKRGTYCASCKRKGKDKARRTVDSRSNRIKRMIELAADARVRWKQDRRHGELSEWIVRRVNDRLPGGWKRIKTNWITRHKAEIETEVEARKDATRKD